MFWALVLLAAFSTFLQEGPTIVYHDGTGQNSDVAAAIADAVAWAGQQDWWKDYPEIHVGLTEAGEPNAYRPAVTEVLHQGGPDDPYIYHVWIYLHPIYERCGAPYTKTPVTPPPENDPGRGALTGIFKSLFKHEYGFHVPVVPKKPSDGDPWPPGHAPPPGETGWDLHDLDIFSTIPVICTQFCEQH